MGYRKITNLQLEHPLFLFKEVYACEKIHGTSSHITLTRTEKGWEAHVTAGGNYGANRISCFELHPLQSKVTKIP
jgi:hypothetical protein